MESQLNETCRQRVDTMEEKCKEQFLVLRDGLAQMVKNCDQKLAVMDHEIMHLDFDQVRMREHDLQTRPAGMQREIHAFRNQILVLTDLIEAHKNSVEEATQSTQEEMIEMCVDWQIQANESRISIQQPGLDRQGDVTAMQQKTAANLETLDLEILAPLRQADDLLLVMSVCMESVKAHTNQVAADQRTKNLKIEALTAQHEWAKARIDSLTQENTES